MTTPGTNDGCCERRSGSLVGPAALITLGILFLLAEFGIVSFHYTWPVLLIVIGIALLVHRSGILEGSSSSDVKEVKHV